MNTNSIFKGIAALAVSLLIGSSANAVNIGQGNVYGLPVEDATLTRNGSLMTVNMEMVFSKLEMHGDKAIVYTPYIVNGQDSLALQPIGLYSRIRWIQYQRKGNLSLGGPDEVAMKYSDRPAVMNYIQHVNFQPWMDGGYLAVKADVYECCRRHIDQELVDLGAKYKEFTPSFLYQTVPDILSITDVEKTRELSGRAFVDFKVNQIVILPDYRNNKKELGKIIASIDSVKNDPDVTVTSITIKGTASPEGPYENNVRLAKGRTEALKEYVRTLYNFPEGFIKTSYEPVDWEGLIEYLNSSTCTLPYKYDILAIVQSDMEPYARNKKIQTTYPTDYKYLLNNIYPSLRHSDYKIDYTIRKFTTVEEIAALIRTQPNKLTLNEMLFLVQSYEPGSDEFNDVFEIAVRMYPEEPLANLNVATSAMQRGDMVSAEKYLQKAGDSAEAVYARANFAFLKGNYQEAAKLYEEAAKTLPEAQKAYEEFKDAGYIAD